MSVASATCLRITRIMIHSFFFQPIDCFKELLLLAERAAAVISIDKSIRLLLEVTPKVADALRRLYDHPISSYLCGKYMIDDSQLLPVRGGDHDHYKHPLVSLYH